MKPGNEGRLEEFRIEVGPQTYTFHDIPLERSVSGKWSLSHSSVQHMMQAVSALILADKDQALTFPELEHLAKTAELSMAKIADLIKIDRSTITKWKRNEGLIPYSDSYCLKDKLPKIIFEFEVGHDSPESRCHFWIEKGGLPRPKGAA